MDLKIQEMSTEESLRRDCLMERCEGIGLSDAVKREPLIRFPQPQPGAVLYCIPGWKIGWHLPLRQRREARIFVSSGGRS
jgi:hypothetical protein